jgi:hypothetical protein
VLSHHPVTARNGSWDVRDRNPLAPRLREVDTHHVVTKPLQQLQLRRCIHHLCGDWYVTQQEHIRIVALICEAPGWVIFDDLVTRSKHLGQEVALIQPGRRFKDLDHRTWASKGADS